MNEVKKQIAEALSKSNSAPAKATTPAPGTAPERITISIAPLENTSAQKPAYI